MTQIMCTPGTHVAQVAHYQAPELNGLLLRLGLTDRLRMRREGLAERDLERGLGEGLTDLVGLLLLREAPFISSIREAPLRVQASPFIRTLAPCIRAGQMWWFTSGAVYSES